MKICVYAISKNEEKFAKRWYESMKEADEIYVLDTGSDDNTVNILTELGAHVTKQKIKPWRFDAARNKSLELVPLDTDICVCTDLDEVFNKGWRKELERNWSPKTTRAKYNYNWCLDENNNPIINFYIDKIHQRKNYKWVHPVHEVLETNDTENVIIIDNITLNHYPDKNKSRAQYLPLLELSVKEDPKDDRNMHYLGREYMYYKKYDKAIETLKKHLILEKAVWKDERAASMRFIGRCYTKLKNFKEAHLWYDKAIKEAPYLRDAYIENALLYYEEENYIKVEEYCLKALRIRSHAKTYINETFSWDETVYDLLSIANYYLKKYEYSLLFVNMAIEINPKEERLRKNKIIIESKIKEIKN